MTIDIIIAVAEKGGVENVIKLMLGSMESEEFHFRVIQMVWEGYRWLDDSVEFHPLLFGRDGHDLNEFVEGYFKFIQESGQAPDVIIAIGWPYLCTVAKLVRDSLEFSAPIISWVHSDIERYEAAGFGGLDQLADADAHFAINLKNYQEITNKFPGKKVFEIHNPVVFPEDVRISKEKGLSYQLLFLGRVSKEKNLPLIFHALQKRKKWVLHIVGDGDEVAELKTLGKNLGLQDRICWHGWRENPWEYLEYYVLTPGGSIEKFDAMVLSSVYEGFPLTIIEAQARGIPVISTDVGGIGEYIKNGINGWLYSTESIEDFTNILEEIEERGYVLESPELCIEEAKPYEKDVVFRKMSEKIQLVCEKKRDRISVIIPCYNAERHVARCLDSIFSQKLSKAELEVICIDDASTDQTLNILKKYEKRYEENMILIPLSENRKQGYGRNAGLDYSTGKYIFFLDSDDYIEENYLEHLYKEAAQTQCDMVVGDFQRVQEGTDPKQVAYGAGHRITGFDTFEKRKYILERGANTGACAKLYLKDFLEEHSIVFMENCFMEDIYFSELCMLYTSKISCISGAGYYYMIHQHSTMGFDNALHYYMDNLKVQNAVTAVALKENLLNGVRDEFMILHFVKAFVEPIGRMRRDKRFLSYPNIRRMKRELLKFFPDILKNPYIHTDPEAEFYIDILQHDYDKKQMENKFH